MSLRDEIKIALLGGMGSVALAAMAWVALDTWRHSRARKQILARGRQVNR